MPLTSKDEYLKSARRLHTGYGPTSDFADASVGTTVQSESGIGVGADDLPGQVFAVDQLPNPDVARAFGLPSVAVPEHLIVDDADTHIQGKSADDIANAALRRSLNDPLIAYNGQVVNGEEASLKQFDDLAEYHNDRIAAENDPKAAKADKAADKAPAHKDPVKA